jgi:uncharacterized membrane protein
MIIDVIGLRTLNEKRVSAYKTVTWRIIGTMDTMLISYMLTGQINVAISIGGIEVVSKMVLYYLHERAWYKLINKNYGTRKN